MTIIEDSTFYGCRSLDLVIPDTIQGIGYSAFENCISLKAVSIPDEITFIENYAFCGCTSLKSVTYHGEKYSNKTAIIEKLKENGVFIQPNVFHNTQIQS